MDGSRFDILTRSQMPTPRSCRRALGTLLAGTLGALRLVHPEAGAAKSGKCKPKCGACETCKKGNCGKKNGRKVCKKGRCRPKPNSTPCGSGGQLCQDGVCACPSGQQDSGGVCATAPTCGRLNAHCDSSAQCRGSFCDVLAERCDCSFANKPCYDTADCCVTPTPLTCIGFICQ